MLLRGFLTVLPFRRLLNQSSLSPVPRGVGARSAGVLASPEHKRTMASEQDMMVFLATNPAPSAERVEGSQPEAEGTIASTAGKGDEEKRQRGSRKGRRKPRSREKPKEKEDGSKEVSGKKDKRRLPPSHFLSLRITNANILEKLDEVQRRMQEREQQLDYELQPSISSVFTPVLKSHITLCVLNVDAGKESELSEVILKSVESYWATRSHVAQANGISVVMEGLGAFQNNVLFAKVKDGDSGTEAETQGTHSNSSAVGGPSVEGESSPLEDLAKIIINNLRAARVAGSEEDPPVVEDNEENMDLSLNPFNVAPYDFKPHVTIAKMSAMKRRKQKSKKGEVLEPNEEGSDKAEAKEDGAVVEDTKKTARLKKIPKQLWEGDAETVFGRDVLQEIELCEMKTDSSTGYYVVQSRFSLSPPSQ
uniref:A-kinase anchor protein 7-like phosphoesterase domain-containing protein n=1 Tax=Palpitomonas bilix TaxID=652834 RepID=A0A7S3G8V9_9EUKA|mmetsp:Transcript_36297/g.94410  ORF Transcript_36297/g.94410 Transcript_36297/m.94410 type:complete len:421 (+) Transcript_36297:125-1387(+)